MADIRPFRAVRPAPGLEAEIAALPYDVYSRAEARAFVAGHPGSFLAIDRAETTLPEGMDIYDDRVYRHAADLLQDWIRAGRFVQDQAPCYYLYAQTMAGRTQTGIVACASIDDYEQNVIKKHENTRADKEQDRIRHVDACGAQTGPIFLCYRQDASIDRIVQKTMDREPFCDFVSEGEVRNRAWAIQGQADCRAIREAFAGIGSVYIADGHHRCASAVRVGQMRRRQDPAYTGEEEFNFFLSVLFPEDQLAIMDYNRVIHDLHGLSPEAFLARVGEICEIDPPADPDGGPVCEGPAAPAGKESVRAVAGARPGQGGPAGAGDGRGAEASEKRGSAHPLDASAPMPAHKGEIGLYLAGRWHLLRVRPGFQSDDPVAGLDVSILQDHILAPLLGIEDPKTDTRIEFVGGIRGTKILEDKADALGGAAFRMYPTSIGELFAVADAGRLMPPKSTWFEPKLLSGLFLHLI